MIKEEKDQIIYQIKKGEYVFVFRPSVDFKSPRNFNCRISTTKPSQIKDLVTFSDFQLTNKNFTDVKDLKICTWAAYGTGDVTKQVFEKLSTNGTYVMHTGNHNEIFGDPNPGYHKSVVISSVSNNKQIARIYKEGVKFEYNTSIKTSEGRDLKKDQNSYLENAESIAYAHYGGMDVLESVRQKMTEDFQINFVLESNMFECPLNDIDSRCLIICYLSDGHYYVSYWNDNEEVKIGEFN